tara:strand:- start:29851 stop:30114 length:264 start_codon:yes stop_codon:yes gene_type:complete
MKKLIKKINRFDTNIYILNQRIEDTKISTYYKMFSNERKRQSDILDLQNRIKDIKNKKHTALESLQLEITKELQKLNTRNEYNRDSA